MTERGSRRCGKCRMNKRTSNYVTRIRREKDDFASVSDRDRGRSHAAKAKRAPTADLTSKTATRPSASAVNSTSELGRAIFASGENRWRFSSPLTTHPRDGFSLKQTRSNNPHGSNTIHSRTNSWETMPHRSFCLLSFRRFARMRALSWPSRDPHSNMAAGVVRSPRTGSTSRKNQLANSLELV